MEGRFFDTKTLSWKYDERNNEVTLCDHNVYRLDQNCFVETVCDAQHGDWRTVIAKDIRPIPSGTQLRVNKVWVNFYGKWVQVIYDGRYYDLNPRYLKYVRREP